MTLDVDIAIPQICVTIPTGTISDEDVPQRNDAHVLACIRNHIDVDQSVLGLSVIQAYILSKIYPSFIMTLYREATLLVNVELTSISWDWHRRDCIFLAAAGLRGSVSLILVQAVVVRSPITRNAVSEVRLPLAQHHGLYLERLGRNIHACGCQVCSGTYLIPFQKIAP